MDERLDILVDIERLVKATPAQVWPYFSQGDLWRRWQDAGTLIRLRHTSLPTDLVPPHDQGWVMCLDLLVGVLEA